MPAIDAVLSSIDVISYLWVYLVSELTLEHRVSFQESLYACWSTPSQVDLSTLRISLVFSIDCSLQWIWSLAWLWTSRNSADLGCNMRWIALAALSVQPRVDKAFGMLLEATSSFLVSDISRPTISKVGC
jgi:hypothetical protein